MSDATEDYELVTDEQQQQQQNTESVATDGQEAESTSAEMDTGEDQQQEQEQVAQDVTTDGDQVVPMEEDPVERAESPDLVAPPPAPVVVAKQPAQRVAKSAAPGTARPPQPSSSSLGKRKDVAQEVPSDGSPLKKQKTSVSTKTDVKRPVAAIAKPAPGKPVSRVPAAAQQAVRALLNQSARPAAVAAATATATSKSAPPSPALAASSSSMMMNGHSTIGGPALAPAALTPPPPSAQLTPLPGGAAMPPQNVSSASTGPSFPVIEDGDERKWVFKPQVPVTMQTPRDGYRNDPIYINKIDLGLLSLVMEQNPNTWYGRHGVGQCRWVYGPRRVQDYHARFRLPPAEISFDGGSGWDGTSRLPKFIDHFKCPTQLLEAAIFIAISTSGTWQKQFCNQWGVNEAMAHAVVRMYDLHKLHIAALAAKPEMLKSFKEGMKAPQDVPEAVFYARKLDDASKTKLPYMDKLKEDAFDLGELAYNKFAGRTMGADFADAAGGGGGGGAGDAKIATDPLWMEMLDPIDRAFFKGKHAAESAASAAGSSHPAESKYPLDSSASGATSAASGAQSDKQASLLDPSKDDMNASEFAASMVEVARRHWKESKGEAMPFNKEKYFRDTAHHNYVMNLDRQREVRKAWRQPTYISMSVDMFTPISQNTEEEKKYQARGESREDRLQRYLRRVPQDSMIREFTYLQQALADGYRYTEFPIFFGNDPMPVSNWFRLLPLFRRGVVAEVIVSPRQVPQTPKGKFYLTWQLDSIRIVSGLKMEMLMQPSSGTMIDNPMLECADPRLIMPPEWHQMHRSDARSATATAARLDAPASAGAGAGTTKLIKGPAEPEAKDGKETKEKQMVKAESGAVIDIAPPTGSEAAVQVGNMTAKQLLEAFRSLKKQMLYFDGITYDPAAPAIIRADKKENDKKF